MLIPDFKNFERNGVRDEETSFCRAPNIFGNAEALRKFGQIESFRQAQTENHRIFKKLRSGKFFDFFVRGNVVGYFFQPQRKICRISETLFAALRRRRRTEAEPFRHFPSIKIMNTFFPVARVIGNFVLFVSGS